MRRSTEKILTTHVGALPAPEDVWANAAVDNERLRQAVVAVCDFQVRAGMDFINEGEVTKGGHWTQYISARLGGFEPAEERGGLGRLLMSSADWVEFEDFYRVALERGTLFEQSGTFGAAPDCSNSVPRSRATR